MTYPALIKNFFMLMFTITIFTNTATHLCAHNDSETIYSQIQPLHLSSLEYEDQDWPNESFHDYLMRCLEYQMRPQELIKRKNIFKLFHAQASKKNSQSQHNVLSDFITAQDLDLLCGKQPNEPYAAQFVDRTKTTLGKVYLHSMIGSPTHDITILEERQKIAQHLVHHTQLRDATQKIYDRLAQRENMLLSFWAQDGFLQSSSRHYFSIPYFKNTNSHLNTSENALEIRSFLGHQQRFVFLATAVFAAIILPIYGLYQLNGTTLPESFANVATRLQGSGGRMLALIASLDNNYVRGCATIAAGVYSGLGAQEEYNWATDNVTLNKCIQTKMIAIADFFNATCELKDLLQKNPTFVSVCPAAQRIIDFFATTVPANTDLAHFVELTQSPSLQGEPSFFTHQGRVLVAFKLMHQLKDVVAPLLMSLAELDAYLSTALLIKEFEDTRVRFCFATFQQSANPLIVLRNFWNPFVSPDIVVPNDLELKGPNAKNMIITGPNAGGKSTLIKGIALNIIFAQSLGIAAAENMTLTPVYSLGTYLNVTDNQALGNSLFKAQVLRAQQMVTTAENTPPGCFSFIALDEMFNGTSTEESNVASFSVTKHIGQLSTTMCAVSTHLPLLTSLVLENSGFKNYKVSVDIDTEKGIHYPFKLEQGISHQHIALDILRQEGYACSIVEEALSLLERKQ